MSTPGRSRSESRATPGVKKNEAPEIIEVLNRQRRRAINRAALAPSVSGSRGAPAGCADLAGFLPCLAPHAEPFRSLQGTSCHYTAVGYHDKACSSTARRAALASAAPSGPSWHHPIRVAATASRFRSHRRPNFLRFSRHHFPVARKYIYDCGTSRTLSLRGGSSCIPPRPFCARSVLARTVPGTRPNSVPASRRYTRGMTAKGKRNLTVADRTSVV